MKLDILTEQLDQPLAKCENIGAPPTPDAVHQKIRGYYQCQKIIGHGDHIKYPHVEVFLTHPSCAARASLGGVYENKHAYFP